jgi:hypothetical protein
MGPALHRAALASATGAGAVQPAFAKTLKTSREIKTKIHFAFRIDIWDDGGGQIIEHVAGVDDFEIVTATYDAAVKRWPAARIILLSRGLSEHLGQVWADQVAAFVKGYAFIELR